MLLISARQKDSVGMFHQYSINTPLTTFDFKSSWEKIPSAKINVFYMCEGRW